MNTIERHLTDAELMRLLDGQEAPAPAHFDPAAHAATCARCGDALATLRADSTLVTGWLERAAFEESEPASEEPELASEEPKPASEGPELASEEPELASEEPELASEEGAGTRAESPSRFGTPVRRAPRTRFPAAGALLKAAAVVLLLSAPLAAFPGVRAWVAARVATTTTTESTSADPDVVVLRFTPTPGGFEVRFPAGTGGLISLERAPGDDAELRALGGTPETVVTASSIEIRNAAEGRYELRLPLTVTGVWIRVGERAVSVSDTQIERGAVVELGS